MRGSMADIQCATAEIRRGKNEEEQTTGQKYNGRATITEIFCPALDLNQYITMHPPGSRGVRCWLVDISITIETLVKHLNSATAKMSWLHGNDYRDKLICRGYAEREGSNDD